MVHPYVAVLDRRPTDLVANPDEVEAILEVGLREFLLDEVWREELWTRSGSPAWPVTFFELVVDEGGGPSGDDLILPFFRRVMLLCPGCHGIGAAKGSTGHPFPVTQVVVDGRFDTRLRMPSSRRREVGV